MGRVGGVALALIALPLVALGALRSACTGSGGPATVQAPALVYAPPDPPAIPTVRPRKAIGTALKGQCGDGGVCKPVTISLDEKAALFEVLDQMRAIQKDWTNPRRLPWKSGCENTARVVDSAADDIFVKLKKARSSIPGMQYTLLAAEAMKACADCDPDRSSCEIWPVRIERAEAEILAAEIAETPSKTK